MKSKLGIILLVFGVLSFFLYQAKDPKKAKSEKEQIIQGKIIDIANNKPIEGASIAIQGHNPSSRSNSEGEFAILAFESQELVIKHSNYKSIIILAKDTKMVQMQLIDTSYTNKVKEDSSEIEIVQ